MVLLGLFQLLGFQSGIDFPPAEKSPGASSEPAPSLGEAAASTACPGSALFGCAEAPRHRELLHFSSRRLLAGVLCSGASECGGPSAQLDAAVSLPCGALRRVERTGLFVSQEEQVYRPSCWNPSFGRLIP